MKPMRMGLLAVGCLAVLTAAVWVAGAGEPARPAAGPLTPLQVGRIVSLKDCGAAYELTTYSREVVGPYRVIELGQDYVVVQDMGGLQDIRIPLQAVKCIININR